MVSNESNESNEVCSNRGCPNDAYILMLPYCVDGSLNKYAGRLYCRQCWNMGSFESISDMSTRWPEGAEL